MKAYFTRLLLAVEALAERLKRLCLAFEAVALDRSGSDHDSDAVVDAVRRIASIEQRLDLHMAEAEGLLLKAENKHKSARAAEERERRYAETRERLDHGAQGDIDFDEAAAAYAKAGIHTLDEAASDPGEMPPVRSHVANGRASRRQALTLAKFGN